MSTAHKPGHMCKIGTCSECGVKPRFTDWAFKGPNGGYSMDPNDYIELCRKCHVQFDMTKEGGRNQGRPHTEESKQRIVESWRRRFVKWGPRGQPTKEDESA